MCTCTPKYNCVTSYKHKLIACLLQLRSGGLRAAISKTLCAILDVKPPEPEPNGDDDKSDVDAEMMPGNACIDEKIKNAVYCLGNAKTKARLIDKWHSFLTENPASISLDEMRSTRLVCQDVNVHPEDCQGFQQCCPNNRGHSFRAGKGSRGLGH